MRSVGQGELTPSSENGANAMKPTILVIEDNEINMEMMIFVLEALGLTDIPALGGLDGLAIAQAELPDLIICDV